MKTVAGLTLMLADLSVRERERVADMLSTIAVEVKKGEHMACHHELEIVGDNDNGE